MLFYVHEPSAKVHWFPRDARFLRANCETFRLGVYGTKLFGFSARYKFKLGCFGKLDHRTYPHLDVIASCRVVVLLLLLVRCFGRLHMVELSFAQR